MLLLTMLKSPPNISETVDKNNNSMSKTDKTKYTSNMCSF